jgi:molecular chaperone Hsp33
MQTDTPLISDQVRRFILEQRPVRGHWAHLESAWRELRAHASYPAPVNELLGQAVAAVVALSATLKFRGTLTFQLQGSGAVRLLVAQCTDNFHLRAVARWDETALAALEAAEASGTLFRDLVGADGRVTVTIEADEKSMRYQGVVPLAGDSLAESLEAYFATSEQLPTRVVLAADQERAAGLLVQKLPGQEADADEQGAAAWLDAQAALARVPPRALLNAPMEVVLPHAFAGLDLRVFRGSPVSFECRCSPGRVAGVLKAPGAGEIRDVLREQGSVTVTCEFCQRPYRFDSIDIEALFTDTPESGHPSALH